MKRKRLILQLVKRPLAKTGHKKASRVHLKVTWLAFLWGVSKVAFLRAELSNRERLMSRFTIQAHLLSFAVERRLVNSQDDRSLRETACRV